MAKVQYVDGNVNNAVLVHGDDPTDSKNVLVTRLGNSESVAKDSVTDLNEHDTSQVPVPEATGDEKDAEIAALKKQLADAEGNG